MRNSAAAAMVVVVAGCRRTEEIHLQHFHVESSVGGSIGIEVEDKRQDRTTELQKQHFLSLLQMDFSTPASTTY
jgi:hypothetical protein